VVRAGKRHGGGHGRRHRLGRGPRQRVRSLGCRVELGMSPGLRLTMGMSLPPHGCNLVLRLSQRLLHESLIISSGPRLLVTELLSVETLSPAHG
jgi:hypothetical protein